MTKQLSLKTQAHQFILMHVKQGDHVIDATIGNGHDTLFLAEHIGERGRVFGFDVQAQAVEETQARLSRALVLGRASIFHASHTQMHDEIPCQYHGKIKGIMFNLGYLPSSDKTVITKAKSTVVALNDAMSLLATQGALTIMAYPGHKGGDDELQQIKAWCHALNPLQFSVQQINGSDKATAPVLFCVLKNN
ncbi:MAG: methyltransferase domain-containing protein [Methylococcales bacterium]|nr:methyltransferase domain-containing protein [Methylococcales bacterium]